MFSGVTRIVCRAPGASHRGLFSCLHRVLKSLHLASTNHHLDSTCHHLASTGMCDLPDNPHLVCQILGFSLHLNLSQRCISRLNAGGGQWREVGASGDITHLQQLPAAGFHV